MARCWSSVITGCPAQLGPGQATLTLPPSAPPSATDAVEWQAFARVDREKGMDKVERAQFFLEFYDGLMNYTGTDHVDHWMKTLGRP